MDLDMEYRIGFAGKYYKLYEYNVTNTEDDGKTYKFETYKFVKVISMSKEKTIKKYPDVIFDDYCNDRKYSSFYKRTLIITNDKFQCGKYAGKYFNMCDDYDYMKWFYNNCATDEQKPAIESILLNNNYVLVNNEFISQETINKNNELDNRKNTTIERLSKGLPFIVNFTANINTCGDYFDKKLQVLLHFKNYRNSYWNDFGYGMPLDSNNKAKRIKNKLVLILKYEIDECNRVIISDWKFA